MIFGNPVTDLSAGFGLNSSIKKFKDDLSKKSVKSVPQRNEDKEFSLDAFVAQIGQSGGLARNNRFKLRIHTDKLVKQNPVMPENWAASYFKNYRVNTDIGKRLVLMAAACELPGRSLLATDMRHYGMTFHSPYTAAIQSCPVTFNVGNDMQEKLFFEAWQSAIMDYRTYDIAYREDYVTDIEIANLDETNEQTYGVVLYEAFPISVDMLHLSHTNQNSYHQLKVTFSFRDWKNVVLHYADAIIDPGYIIYDFLDTVQQKTIEEGGNNLKGVNAETNSVLQSGFADFLKTAVAPEPSE